MIVVVCISALILSNIYNLIIFFKKVNSKLPFFVKYICSLVFLVFLIYIARFVQELNSKLVHYALYRSSVLTMLLCITFVGQIFISSHIYNYTLFFEKSDSVDYMLAIIVYHLHFFSKYFYRRIIHFLYILALAAAIIYGSGLSEDDFIFTLLIIFAQICFSLYVIWSIIIFVNTLAYYLFKYRHVKIELFMDYDNWIILCISSNSGLLLFLSILFNLHWN